MKTKDKNKIVNELIESVCKMSAQVLHKNLQGLDMDRYTKVINSLTPQKFKELVEYDSTVESYSDIWRYSESIRVNLLDALDPILLIKIGAKGCAHDTEWGGWMYNQEDKEYSRNLTEYLSNCSAKRLSEIMVVLIESTKNVTAPASERNYDIFKFIEGKEFPFETIDLLHHVHPKNLFLAINMISADNLKRMFWLAKKFMMDDDPFESVFHGEYGKKYYFDQRIFECISKHIGVLSDAFLLKFLNSFGEEAQDLIVPEIGKDRVIAIHSAGFSIKGFYIPEEWNLFPDKKSNESLIKKIESGEITKINRLSAKKQLELLGALA
jgi:hypothetical protein